jgi:Transglutaminase-like superfamily
MKAYALESSLLLLRFEFVMLFRGFKNLHGIVSKRNVYVMELTDRPSVECLCKAVDYACVFYFKRVLCLQRSAAATLLLRRYGWTAEMVIGAQMLPFKSHAWVEVDGVIVNDKPYMPDIYQVLERC